MNTTEFVQTADPATAAIAQAFRDAADLLADTSTGTADLMFRMKLAAQAGEIDKATEAQVALKKKQAAQEQAQRDVDLQREQITGLQAAAKLGDVNAAMEAKRLAIQTQFNQKRLEYQKIIDDQNSTDSQRNAAQALLAGLGPQEKAAMMMSGMLGPTADNVAKFSARGSGSASRAREENSPQLEILKAAQASNALLQEIVTTNKEVARALSSGGGATPALAHVR